MRMNVLKRTTAMLAVILLALSLSFGAAAAGTSACSSGDSPFFVA